MKLIKFAIDFRSTLNLPPMFGLPNGLKAGDVRYPKGTVMKVNDWLANSFCKQVIDWEQYEKTGKLVKRSLPAYVLKDLGCYHQKVCRERKKRKVELISSKIKVLRSQLKIAKEEMKND